MSKKPDDDKSDNASDGGNGAAKDRKQPKRVAEAQDWPARYRICKAGLVNGHVTGGLLITGGFGFTDDATRAHASLEDGCEVLDATTGKEAWPKDPEKPAKK